MKKIKILASTVALSLVISSCGVQQFAVNTEVQPFQNGGTVFGEKTNGKTIMKSGDLFVFGTNVIYCNTEKMAKEINATHYTIETKQNLLSFIISGFTGGLFDYRVVKVIKRDK
jgi:hypothetical protein